MSKVYGGIENFAPVRQDRSAIYVCYNKEDVDEEHCTWYEQCYYKKQHPDLTIEEVKKDVLADINAQTDEKILTGFVWNGKKVWLSQENQRNFSEAQRVAMMTEGQSLPVRFKLGEDEEGNPVYHTFTKVSTLNDFYLAAVAYIQKCLADGWAIKDAINWQEIEEGLPTTARS